MLEFGPVETDCQGVAMDWLTTVLKQLTPPDSGTRAVDSESCALAALALSAHEAFEQATGWNRLLGQRQLSDGSVSMWGDDAFPKWTTSLATLAWQAAELPEFARATQRGVAWMLSSVGETPPRSEIVGHDTTLPSWPWVAGTHGWVEPTAFHLLALKATGLGQHLRSQQATDMLLDRQLTAGGCNYGNTVVLGQELRPHLQPSGIAMLGLVGTNHPKIVRSLDYLTAAVRPSQTIDSLAWGLIGLAAHARVMPEHQSLLTRVWERRSLDRTHLRQKALICLAARPEFLSSLAAKDSV